MPLTKSTHSVSKSVDVFLIKPDLRPPPDGTPTPSDPSAPSAPGEPFDPDGPMGPTIDIGPVPVHDPDAFGP